MSTLQIISDISKVQSIDAVPRILENISTITGMRFTCVARVTESAWTVCAAYDTLGFKLFPGDELPVETTFCTGVRSSGQLVVFDSASADPKYRDHPSPKHYGFESYVSLPLYRKDGEFFGTLCALDPLPATPSNPTTLASLQLFAELISLQLESEEQEQTNEIRHNEISIQLRASNNERDRAWILSQDLLATVNADGTFSAVNQAWSRLAGWTEEDMVGTAFHEYVHPDDLEPTLVAFAGLAEAPLVNPHEYRLKKKDGEYRWFAWTAVQDGDKVFANGRDTQAVHDQAEALARSEASVRQMQKMEAIGQLTSGIAHDFNNLLAAITGSMEVMRIRLSQGRYDDLERYVGAALGAARRAAALTHRLLAFSRQQTLDPKALSVNRLIAGMEELIARTVGPQITVEVIAAGGLWPAFVDESQIENALLNLCINSRDAMPEGGKLTIETANRWFDDRSAKDADLPPGQYISMCVSDNGTGMPAEVAARAFDPFYTTKPLGAGSGLGLSMVYGFARQSGGQVRIYSEVGDGTMVCVYLPRHLASPAIEHEAPAPTLLAHAKLGETVLVVEDEHVLRMLIVDFLKDMGYTTLEASDGVTGLQILESEQSIDLVISDIGLPGGLNGRKMVETALQTNPRLKVLFITGYAENAVFNHGHLAPGMQVLTKPFEMAALGARCEALLSQGQQPKTQL